MGDSSVAFSPNGRTIASSSRGNNFHLWDTATGKLRRTIAGHSGWVNSVAFSPDGHTLATGGGSTIRLWDADTGKLRLTITGSGSVESVTFSPDGLTLASGGSGDTIRLWDARTGKLRLTVAGSGSVKSVAFSPDGLTLASVRSWDDSIRLWNARTGKLRLTITGHTSWVNSVAFSHDGYTLASASWDGTVLLWELSSSSGVGVDPLGRHLTTMGNIKRTALLQNYPNPFNPETWIPYHLEKDSLVTLIIYDQNGHIVRLLDIGHQVSGIYRDKAEAAYWDGRNQNGEPVTSGTYYYQLRAGDYTAARRMVIVR